MRKILFFITLCLLAGCTIERKSYLIIPGEQKTFSRATTPKDTVNVKPFEDLTLVDSNTVDSSDQFLLYDISAGLFSYRITLGEVGRAVSEWISTNSGSGNVSGRAMQSIVADGTDTLDFGQFSRDFHRVDLSNVTSTTLTFTNPNTTVVPDYNIHFTNVSNDTVYFNTTLLTANLDTALSHIFTQGQIVPMYYLAGDYYTNYLSLAIGSGGGAGGSGGFATTEYQNIITHATNNSYTLPNTATQNLQDTLIDTLKTIGVWDSIELFYVFRHDIALDSFSLINWKDTLNHRLIERVNGVVYSTQGVRAADNDSYLDTQFDFLNDATIVDNSGVSFAYMIDSIPVQANFFGVATGSPTTTLIFNAYNSEADSIFVHAPFSGQAVTDNDVVSYAVIGGDDPLNKVVHSTGVGGSKTSYVDGTLIGSVQNNTNKNTFSSDNLVLLANNYGGVGSFSLDDSNMAFFLMARQMSAAKIQAVADALNRYFDQL